MPGVHTERQGQGLPWPIYTIFSLAPLFGHRHRPCGPRVRARSGPGQDRDRNPGGRGECPSHRLARRRGSLARCVDWGGDHCSAVCDKSVIHWALPREEEHRVGLWPGRLARAPPGMGLLRVSRVLVWRGICRSVRPKLRVTCRPEMFRRFQHSREVMRMAAATSAALRIQAP
jgi:hypothetical protein